ARALAVGKPRFPSREPIAADLSHPAIAVHLDACIQCTRCVRACRDVQVNDVIGLAYRGEHEKPVFDMDDAMGASTCVACGECVQACPTGALMPAGDAALVVPDKSVAALLEGIGSCAVSNPVMDVTKAAVVLLIGANPTVNHPVAATWMKNAASRGTKLIVCDPRRSELSRIAYHHLQFNPDTDVAL